MTSEHGSDSIEVSVVVCTRNRAESLSRCLDAFARISAVSTTWELVVVDNGSTDATPDVLARAAEGFGERLRVLHEPTRGLGGARNRGWQGATGAIVACTDDDCYPEPDYVDAIAACFAEDPGLDFLGGRIRLYDPTDLPITIHDEPDRRDVLPHRFVPAYRIQGANFAFRRALAEEIGGFDPLLGAGARFPAGEDFDFVARAAWLGHRGAYDPRPVVWHHHGRKTPADRAAIMRQYATGSGACLAKRLLDRRSRRVFARASLEQVWDDLRTKHTLGQLPRQAAAAIEYAFVRARAGRGDRPRRVS